MLLLLPRERQQFLPACLPCSRALTSSAQLLPWLLIKWNCNYFWDHHTSLGRRHPVVQEPLEELACWCAPYFHRWSSWKIKGSLSSWPRCQERSFTPAGVSCSLLCFQLWPWLVAASWGLRWAAPLSCLRSGKLNPSPVRTGSAASAS